MQNPPQRRASPWPSRRDEDAMAKLWVKFQRSFRRRPVRFFTLLALYLAAGSLVFLHAGFTGEPRVTGSQRSPGAGEGLGLPYLGATRLSRGFSEVTVGRRRGHWFKGMAKEPAERSRAGDYGAARSRAPKGRGGRDKEEDREVKLEAKAALNQALEMKRQGKREKAHKLFVYALKMDPDYVDALNEFGIFSEEEKDILQADYLYSKALTLSPCNEKALINRDRTLPLVEEIDQRYFSIIDSKVKKVMAIPKGNSALRRVMEESYYHHIYHTVAIEGNTLTLSEIRHIIETRYAVPGKSLVEQNEGIGSAIAIASSKRTWEEERAASELTVNSQLFGTRGCGS